MEGELTPVLDGWGCSVLNYRLKGEVEVVCGEGLPIVGDDRPIIGEVKS